MQVICIPRDLRNDQVITDLKIWMKASTKEIIQELNKIMKTTLKSRKKYPNRNARIYSSKKMLNLSFAHYLLAYIEMFLRDKKRFHNNLELLNESPLGAAALTGTSFNIDRNYTSKKLGFKKPTNNSIDTVSDRDFVLDYLYSCSVCAMHFIKISRRLYNFKF